MEPVVRTLSTFFSTFLLPINSLHFIASQNNRFFFLIIIPSSLSAISMEVRSIARKQTSTEKERKDKIIEVVNDEEEDEDKSGGGGVHAEEDKKKGGGGSGRRGSSGGCGVPSPFCQAERCGAVLSDAKRYHRRHKVCEFHSKAPVVIVAGLRQRFCQQCSRFHDLREFDEAKRSCRRRLAEHNERRRKSATETSNEGHHNPMEGHCKQVDDGGRRVHHMNIQSGSSSSKSFHIR